MSDEAKWYIVHTYSGYENKVASDLETTIDNRGLRDMIQEVYVPTEVITEIKDNKSKTVERKIFPSYVVVKMILTDATWYVVRNIRGCTGFVGPNGEPTPLTDIEVERLGINKHKIIVPYEVGDIVSIGDGPMKGNTGKVVAIDTENENVQVNVSMFGRETPVELKLSQVDVLH